MQSKGGFAHPYLGLGQRAKSSIPLKTLVGWEMSRFWENLIPKCRCCYRKGAFWGSKNCLIKKWSIPTLPELIGWTDSMGDRQPCRALQIMNSTLNFTPKQQGNQCSSQTKWFIEVCPSCPQHFVLDHLKFSSVVQEQPMQIALQKSSLEVIRA